MSSTWSSSRLCGSQREFSAWLMEYDITLMRERKESPHEHVKYPIQLVNATLNDDDLPREDPRPRIDDPTVAECLGEFRASFQFVEQPGGATQDEFSVCRNLRTIIQTYIEYYTLGRINAASLRAPVDSLLHMVFVTDGSMHHQNELSIPLPGFSEDRRQKLGLDVCGFTEVGATIYGKTTLDLANLSASAASKFRLKDSLYILPRKCTGESYIAIPEIVIEYEKEAEDIVKNKLVLDISAALLHRTYLNLPQRPVHGLAVFEDRCYFYYGRCIDNEPNVTQYTNFCRLARFNEWLRFYITLVKIRNEIEADPLPDIALSDVLPKEPWTCPPGTVTARGTKRRPSGSSHKEPPNKKRKTNADSAPESANSFAAGSSLTLHAPKPVHSKAEYAVLNDFPDSTDPSENA